MILLDTNVVSEAMRQDPAPAVLAWLDGRQAMEVFLTAISEAELRTGAAILPAGRRRDRVVAAVDNLVAEVFADRILPFDSAAARAYAAVASERRSAGRPMPEADCRIAAIARVHGAVLATRNLRDFEGCGLTVVDPWQGG